MKKKILLSAVATLILASLFPAAAQQPKKVSRIGFLAPATRTGYQHQTDAFLQGLRELGYVEGQNIVIEYRWADGNFERLPELAAELVRLKVDVIVAPGVQAVRAAKQSTTTIPVIFPTVGDAVASGLVASLARPGGNITGLTILSPELSGKRLELLKEAFPKVTRVALLWNPLDVAGPIVWKETEAATQALGLQLQSLAVSSPED